MLAGGRGKRVRRASRTVSLRVLLYLPSTGARTTRVHTEGRPRMDRAGAGEEYNTKAPRRRGAAMQTEAGVLARRAVPSPVGPTPYDQVQREVQKTLDREGTVRRSRYGRGGRSGVARGRGPAGGAQSTDPRRSQFAPRRTGNPLPRGGPVTAPARGALLRRTPAAPSGEGRTPRGAEIPPRPAAPSCPSLLQRLAGSPSTFTYPTLATIHRAPLMARALPFWRRAPPPPFPASRRPRST